MVATLLHGWVWFTPAFSGDRRVLMNMTKGDKEASADTFLFMVPALCRQGCLILNDGHMNQWVNQLKERRGFNKT